MDVAPDVATAISLVRESSYQLLLTDFRLPDGDGLALMRQVRAAQPDCEVLVMTAYGNIPLAVEAMREGAWDFLTKPFKRAELEHAVAKALDKQALMPRTGGCGSNSPREAGAPPGARRHEPRDAAGDDGRRAGGGQHRHRAHHGRERHGQGGARRDPARAQSPA